MDCARGAGQDVDSLSFEFSVVGFKCVFELSGEEDHTAPPRTIHCKLGGCDVLGKQSRMKTKVPDSCSSSFCNKECNNASTSDTTWSEEPFLAVLLLKLRSLRMPERCYCLCSVMVTLHFTTFVVFVYQCNFLVESCSSRSCMQGNEVFASQARNIISRK